MRHHAPQRVRDPAFVDGIGVGVQQADRDRLDARPLEPGDHTVQLGVGQRLHHLAGMIKPFTQAETPLARHQRRRLRRHVQPVQVGAPVSPELQHVLEPLRRHQGHRRQTPFHDGVGDPRSTVHEAPQRVRGKADRRHRLQHRVDGGTGAGQHLGHPPLAGFGVNGDDIGKSAADVGADFPGGHAAFRLPGDL